MHGFEHYGIEHVGMMVGCAVAYLALLILLIVVLFKVNRIAKRSGSPSLG
jgi:hypothetical protein